MSDDTGHGHQLNERTDANRSRGRGRGRGRGGSGRGSGRYSSHFGDTQQQEKNISNHQQRHHESFHAEHADRHHLQEEQSRGGLPRSTKYPRRGNKQNAYTHSDHQRVDQNMTNPLAFHKRTELYQKRENAIYDGKVSFLSEKDGFGYIERDGDHSKFKFVFTPNMRAPAQLHQKVSFMKTHKGEMNKSAVKEVLITKVIDPLVDEMRTKLASVLENIYQCRNHNVPTVSFAADCGNVEKENAIFALDMHLRKERLVQYPGVIASFEEDLRQQDRDLQQLINTLTREKQGINSILKDLLPQVKLLEQAPHPQNSQQVQLPLSQQQLGQLQQSTAPPIEPLLNKVQEAVNKGEIVNAVQQLCEIQYTDQIPNTLLCTLYQNVLEGVPYGTSVEIPDSVRKSMIQFMSDAIHQQQKSRNCFDLYAQQRKICTLYGQRLNIRRYELMTLILQNIAASCPVHILQTLPKLTHADYLTLQQYQTYLSALLIGMPKKSLNILKVNKIIKDKMKVEEEKRSLALRHASISSINSKTRVQREQPLNLQQAESVHVDESNHLEEQQEEFDGVNGADVEESEEMDEDESDVELLSNHEDQLTREIMTQFRALEPTQDEIEKKKALCLDIQNICYKVFKGNPCTVHTYGSSASGFGLQGSDIDMCIKFDAEVKDTKIQTQLLKLLEKAIDTDLKQDYGHFTCKEERGVIRSRVPILKIVDSQRTFECDICIENFLGVVNTRMLQVYSQIDERVRPFVYAIKYWTKRRHISDPPSGSLSSYSHVLMAIHYLQTVQVLPSLQDMINDQELDVDIKNDIPLPHYWNAYDCRYFGNLAKIKQVWAKRASVTEVLTVGDLLTGFFRYYGSEFNFAHSCVSITDIGTAKQKLSSAPISIEDPFERRELGSVVSNEMGPKIIAEYKRAHNILSAREKSEEDLFDMNLLEVLCEERTDVNNEVNIYLQKQDYEEYLPEEQVNQELEAGKLYRGIIRTNKKRFREAFVTIEGFERDVLIDGFKARNRALHGDVVAVKIVTSKRADSDGNASQISAIVVRILEKKSPTYFACSIMKEDGISENKGFRWLIPIDKSFPKMMVHFEEFRRMFAMKASGLEEVVFIAEINQPWKQTQHYPRGRIQGTLGLRKDMWSQKRALLLQNVPNLWNSIIERSKLDKKSLPNVQVITPTDIKIDEQVLREYRDCRPRRIFTIDPTTSRDLDDALSIEKIASDRYLVTVYIADVNKFVREGDSNDVEACKRGTSVYMIDSVEHMLDPVLSQNLASLHAGVTRYTLSVEFIMNEEGELLDTNDDNKGNVGVFNRDVIASCCRLDYDQVQAIIKGKEKDITLPPVIHPEYNWDDVRNDVLLMNRIAQKLRQKRRDNNSLFLSNEEIYFEMDNINEGGTGYPTACHHAEHNESHQLVEEFMLVANQLAAKALVHHYPDDALLRNHPSPDRDKWTTTVTKITNAIVKTYNVEKNPLVDQILNNATIESYASIQQVMNDVVSLARKYGTVAMQTVQHCLMREMQLAKYVRAGDCVGEKSSLHFALNMLHYTHFTSPIRRYADVIVHRMLLQMMRDKEGNNGELKLRGTQLTQVVQHLNDQAYRAKTAQENAQRTYLSFYLIPSLQKRVERNEAVVISLGRRSFTIYVPKYCIEINCNVMSQFVPAPDSISSRDKNNVVQQQTEEQIDEEGRNIDELTLSWNGTRPNISLTVMKTILVDMDVNYDILPYDVFVYAVWDLDEKRAVRVVKSNAAHSSAILNMSPQSAQLNQMLKNKVQEEQMKQKISSRAKRGRGSRKQLSTKLVNEQQLLL